MKKFLVLTLICLAFCVKANAVYVPTQLYMFAFGRSFNDSIVYISDLQTVDSTWLDNRHGFLYSRSTYSYQFKNYMSELGVENPTTCVIFSAKLKKAEKAYLKLKKKYTKTPGEWEVNFVSINDFAFEAISALDDPSVNTINTKEARKAEKKAEKEARKAKKGSKQQMPPRGGGPGGGPGGGGPGGGGMGGPGGGMGGPGGGF